MISRTDSSNSRPLALLFCLLLPGVMACSPAPEPAPDTTLALREDWHIVSSAEETASADAVSTVGFDDQLWTPTTVPSTVLAALASSGEIPNPYYARGLEKLPAGQFDSPWWYRTEFNIDGPLAGGNRLVFEGINYSAEVWLNGQRVAAREDLVGAFRMFEVEVSDALVAGDNALAVLVYPPEPGDPTIGFVDWNPTPPDRSMGLWRGVTLRQTNAVTLDRVFVRSDLDLETLDSASLTLTARLRNETDESVEAQLVGTIDQALAFEHVVTLGPGEEASIKLGEEDFEALRIDNPRLWWPNHMGEPNLYDLVVEASVGKEVSDRQEVTFGIRHVDDFMTESGHRGYTINGKELLIRGGGWVDELMLDADSQRIEDQMRYVKHMNLNTIRLEGFWGNSRELYEIADRYGILVMVGWSCQWEWEEYYGAPVDEFGGIDSPEEMEIVTLSLRDQVRWLRNHPSILVWLLASDMLPRPELESRYMEALADIDTTRPTLATCAVGVSEVSGPSGVKMNGPYDWVPPTYWYLDRERGGAYGFNTETGPGPQPPPLRSIQRMLPEENWWPIDTMWEYHCGRHEFNTLDRYKAALDARYGEATDLADFARKAQVANYEGMRAMFEAFSIRRPETTGLIQWMLNSAWPEMYWQLYDHYLVPNGAFYGAMHAARPINLGFDYAERTFHAINDTAQVLEGAVARVRVLDLDSQTIFDQSAEVTLGPGERSRLFELPGIESDDAAYFVDARLSSADGEALASSFYWLAHDEDELAWEDSTWFYTPTSRYADFTGLASLPAVELDVAHEIRPTPDGYEISVHLKNPSDKLAFFVELSILGSESGLLAAPIYWSDNYLSLLPGESREIVATVPAHALEGDEPQFVYEGMNVAAGS